MNTEFKMTVISHHLYVVPLLHGSFSSNFLLVYHTVTFKPSVRSETQAVPVLSSEGSTTVSPLSLIKKLTEA